jgi:hypothetical protein
MTAIIPWRSETLSRQELYLFDTMGLVHIPRFLDTEGARLLREEATALTARRMEGRGDKERFDDLAQRSPIISALASSSAMRGLVEPVVNQPYRLIESYALRRERDSIFYLHNGHSEHVSYGEGRVVHRNMGLSHTCHDGKLFCMFIKVLVYLSDVQSVEDGPLCYLHGSHKASFPWFSDSEAAGAMPALTPENFPSLGWTFVRRGDAIVLNEALLHGTLPKTTAGERLVAAFSFAPAFVADYKEIDRHSDDLTKLGHY